MRLRERLLQSTGSSGGWGTSGLRCCRGTRIVQFLQQHRAGSGKGDFSFVAPGVNCGSSTDQSGPAIFLNPGTNASCTYSLDLTTLSGPMAGIADVDITSSAGAFECYFFDANQAAVSVLCGGKPPNLRR